MFNVETLKANTDLIALAERDTTLKRKGAKEYCAPCPFCGGRDRFAVQSDKWLCRNCTQGKWQDVIAYIQRRENCDFRTACETLRVGAIESLPIRPRAIAPGPEPSEPAQDWQSKARIVIAQCADNLWSDTGARARTYLNGRGLNDDTMRQWQLGYLPGLPTEWREIAGLRVPCGMVIPCEIGDAVWYIKVRRSHDAPKYEQIAGGKSALFGADTLPGKRTAILTEGEFDAMLLHQAAGDLVGVATMGGATTYPSESMMRYLLPVAKWLICYDLDDAGASGAQWWANKSQRARRVYIPKIVPTVKDISDYRHAGGNLKDWVEFIAGNEMKRKKQDGIYDGLLAKWNELLDRAEKLPNDSKEIDDVLAEWHKVDARLCNQLDAMELTKAIRRNG